MWFFGQKQPGLNRKTEAFLNKVDEAYMRAFSTKGVKALMDYMSPECLSKVRTWVYTTNIRYFGAEKFRTTTWEVLTEKNGILSLRKTVVFAKVKVTNRMSMKVAEDYEEVWRVDTNAGLRVVDIYALT